MHLARLNFRPAFASLLLVLCLGGTPSARAWEEGNPTDKVPIRFRCEMQSMSQQQCSQMMAGFFSAHGSHFQDADADDAPEVYKIKGKGESPRIVKLKITDQTLPNDIRYSFAWSNKSGSYEPRDFTLDITLQQSLDAAAREIQLIVAIAKGAVLYLHAETSGAQEGRIELSYGNRVKREEGAKEDSESPYYYEFSGSLSGNKSAANSNLNASSGFAVNYSTSRVRVIVSGNGNYRQASVVSGGQTIRGDNLSHFEQAIISVSTKPDSPEQFSGRWNVALIAQNQANAGANIRNAYSAMAATEWSLVPYRVSENKEFLVRLGAGVESLNLNQPNQLDHIAERYGFALAQLYTFMILADSKVTLNASTTYVANLNYRGYDFMSVNAGINYQITPTTRLNMRANYGFQKQTLNTEKDSSYKNAVQSGFTSQVAGQTTNFSVGVVITLKNSLRRSRDRRWANF